MSNFAHNRGHSPYFRPKAFMVAALVAATFTSHGQTVSNEADVAPPWIHQPIYTLPATNKPVVPEISPQERNLLALLKLSWNTSPAPAAAASFDHLGSLYSLVPQPLATNITSPLLDLQRRRTKAMLDDSLKAYKSGELDQAISILEERSADITDADLLFRIYHRLGAYLFRAGRYQAAAEYMQKALQLRPGNPALACNLAATQMTIGKPDQALETLSFIPVSLLSDSNLLFSVYFNYACAYSLKGETEKALDNLEKAARYDPEATLASIGDIQLDPIRTHPQFQQLVADLETRLLFGP